MGQHSLSITLQWVAYNPRNIAVLQTTVAELVKVKEHQRKLIR